MRSEGSRLGVRLCSRKVVSVSATVRKCSQPFAIVCVSAVKLSTAASASGLVLKACEVDPFVVVILVSAEEVSV